MKRLYDIEHSYYCNEQNFYKGGCEACFDSWADFVESEGDADKDYNLLFRWDWRVDDESKLHKLQLFYMMQRKGAFRSCTVRVTVDDEPAVRAWLLPHWAHMQSLWAPLPAAGTVPQSNDDGGGDCG
jgi:hypothetical protein